MSQPGYGDSYGAGYRANQGQQNSQSYNPQGSWGNQGINMDNQSEMHPPQGGQPHPYYPPSSAGGWGSDPSVVAPSGQYYVAPPVQSDLYNSGSDFSQQGHRPGPDFGASSGGDQGQMELDQGTMGQMDVSYGSYGGEGFDSETFDEERPLLEELGVDLKLIRLHTLSVLNPVRQMDSDSLKDSDLAGPLLFCLLFGVILLLSGKVHFGYIYGVGLLGCTSMYVVLNLMSTSSVSVGCVVSTLGYCLLPMVLLSCVSIVLQLQGILGSVLSLVIIGWCSYSASKLFVTVLSMHSMQLLIAYPCALLYGVFALLTVF